ncbi:MAG: TonB-dependent receptor [Myxococcota bacterium]
MLLVLPVGSAQDSPAAPSDETIGGDSDEAEPPAEPGEASEPDRGDSDSGDSRTSGTGMNETGTNETGSGETGSGETGTNETGVDAEPAERTPQRDSHVSAEPAPETGNAQAQVPPPPEPSTVDVVRGTLIDEDEFPVAFASVRVGELSVDTDADGRFEVPRSAFANVETVTVQGEGIEPLLWSVPDALPPSLELIAVASDGFRAVVTVGRRRERQNEAVGRVEVIQREEIATSGARNAAELLEERSALQIQRSFRGAAIFLRGLDPEYVLVLIDGDRLPGATGGAIDLSRFGVENIERIEVVRGPSSALYGSEAIGGVVNIIPRDDGEPFAATASLSSGVNEGGPIVDGTGFVSGRLGRFRLQGSGGFHRTPSFGVDERGVTDGSERTQWSLDGAARYEHGGHRARISGTYIRTDLQGVDAGAGRALFDRRQIQEQSLVAFTHRIERGRFAMRSRMSLGSYRQQFVSDQRGASELDSIEDNREWLGQMSTVLSTEVGEQHVLTFGVEQLFQRLDSERLRDRGDRYRLAGFAEHRWRMWEDGERSAELALGARVDLDSQFGNQPSPKIALRIDPHPDWTLRASYGRGFRAPSFQELLLRFENPTVGYVVDGNENLDAERSHSVDVSADWVPNEHFGLGAAFFRNDLSQMITVVTAGTSAQGIQFSYGNIASAWTMGAELNTRFRLDERLDVRVGYAYTRSQDEEQDRALEGRATHRLNTRVSSRIPVLDLDLTARLVVQFDRVFYDADGNRLDIDPLAQLDLRAGRSIGEHVELFVGLDNVLSAGDAFAALLPRTFYGGVRGSY